LALGLAIVVYDAYVIVRYGFDINDVAGMTDDGGPIDWPTGERPAFASVPAFVYGFVFWLAAAVVFALWPEVGKPYTGRIRRGTE
jgi:hypothetical protein